MHRSLQRDDGDNPDNLLLLVQMSSLWHVCRWSCQIYKCETRAKYKIQNVKYINWKYGKSTKCCFSHLLRRAFTNIEGGYKRTTTLPFGDFHGSDTDPLTGGGKPDPRWTIYFHDNCPRSKVKIWFPIYLTANKRTKLNSGNHLRLI